MDKKTCIKHELLKAMTVATDTYMYRNIDPLNLHAIYL